VALCGVCMGKPLSEPYSVNSTSRISVLVRMQLKRHKVRRFVLQSGLGREEDGLAETLVRLTLLTRKQFRTNCFTETECSLDLTVARGLL